MAAVEDELQKLLRVEECALDADSLLSNFAELLSAALNQAPALCSRWDVGVSVLLRISAAAPRQHWLRSPKEPWFDTAGAIRRLLLRTKPDPTEITTREALETLLQQLFCKYPEPPPVAFAGGFTWSDGAGVAFEDGAGSVVVTCSELGLRSAMRFAHCYVAAGRGESLVSAAKQFLAPSLTRRVVRSLAAQGHALPPPPQLEAPDSLHHQQPDHVRLVGPVARLREAQVDALGGPQTIAQAAALGTRLGASIGSAEDEEFAQSVLEWGCRSSLDDIRSAGCAMEWLLAERSADPSFSVNLRGNPRSAKKVLEAAARAAESLELRRLQATGELFPSNPIGIKGFVKPGVEVAFDPHALVALSETYSPSSWNGDEYEPSDAEHALLQDPSARRRATVRIEEVRSFEYLQHVGQQMQNCLRVERRGGSSLFKYLSRARAGRSSFWVLTATPEENEELEERAVEHMLLIEVFHELRVVHQAEGPHPRRWPRLDAWAWLKEWAEREGLSPDGPEGVTRGPGGWYSMGWGVEAEVDSDPWDINRCFIW